MKTKIKKNKKTCVHGRKCAQKSCKKCTHYHYFDVTKLPTPVPVGENFGKISDDEIDAAMAWGAAFEAAGHKVCVIQGEPINPRTVSTAQDIDLGEVLERVCPICKRLFQFDSSSQDFEHLEHYGTCLDCFDDTNVYYEVYERVPTDGGDCYRTIVIREAEHEANLILKALEDTNIDWSDYGVRRIEKGATLDSTVDTTPAGRTDTWFDRLVNFIIPDSWV